MQKRQDPRVTNKTKEPVSALFDSARKPEPNSQGILRQASYLALSAMIGLGSAACANTTANAVQGTKEPVIAGYSVKAPEIPKGGAAMYFTLPKITGAQAEVNIRGGGFSLIAGFIKRARQIKMLLRFKLNKVTKLFNTATIQKQ